jgi:hypothetical protein
MYVKSSFLNEVINRLVHDSVEQPSGFEDPKKSQVHDLRAVFWYWHYMKEYGFGNVVGWRLPICTLL